MINFHGASFVIIRVQSRILGQCSESLKKDSFGEALARNTLTLFLEKRQILQEAAFDYWKLSSLGLFPDYPHF